MERTLSGSFHIEKLDAAGVGATIELALGQGWDSGLHDAPAFFVADNGGFFAGKIDGRMAGSIFAVNYGNDFAFLGRYIILQQFRGLGYGSRLWSAALEHIGNRPAGLNAALSMAEKYKLHGFQGAHPGARFAMKAHKAATPEGIVSAKSIPFEDIARFDRRYFPAERTAFLRKWLDLPESKSAACVDAKGVIHAYGIIRLFNNSSWKIGPLFADSFDAADATYEALQARVPEGNPVFIDFTPDNADALKLARRRDMQKLFENLRMYRGNVPSFDESGLFSYASNELG